MDPDCFSIGCVHVRWYGIMAALGFISAYALLNWRAKRYSMKNEAAGNLLTCALLSAIAGARALYVIRFWDEEFADGPFIEVFKVYNGGLVFFGGFALALAAVLCLSLKNGWKLYDVADLCAPALPLGHALGRIGCLLNGCCHGVEYHGPCAMTYNYISFPTFPLQLFSAAGNLCICLFLLWLEKTGRMKGRLFFCYLVLYSIGRFCIEFGRGDYPQEQLWHGLTPAQVTCLWLLPATLAVYGIMVLVFKEALPWKKTR